MSDLKFNKLKYLTLKKKYQNKKLTGSTIKDFKKFFESYSLSLEAEIIKDFLDFIYSKKEDFDNKTMAAELEKLLRNINSELPIIYDSIYSYLFNLHKMVENPLSDYLKLFDKKTDELKKYLEIFNLTDKSYIIQKNLENNKLPKNYKNLIQLLTTFYNRQQNDLFIKHYIITQNLDQKDKILNLIQETLDLKNNQDFMQFAVSNIDTNDVEKLIDNYIEKYYQEPYNFKWIHFENNKLIPFLDLLFIAVIVLHYFITIKYLYFNKKISKNKYQKIFEGFYDTGTVNLNRIYYFYFDSSKNISELKIFFNLDVDKMYNSQLTDKKLFIKEISSFFKTRKSQELLLEYLADFITKFIDRLIEKNRINLRPKYYNDKIKILKLYSNFKKELENERI